MISSTRSWLRAGQVQHHLIDPRSGLPAESPWRYVTACAATCVGADVAAKIGFLRGESGPEWLDARGIAARFVTPAGAERVNDAWRQSLHSDEPFAWFMGSYFLFRSQLTPPSSQG